MGKSAALSSKEKVLVALAAAMGGGCRTCAERLYAMAESAGATADEVAVAFADGLHVRRSATEVMQHKAGELMGRIPDVDASPRSDKGSRITELSKLAAAVAANSSPDALRHLEAARFAGASDEGIGVAIGIGRKVRSKAQGFSDEEIGELRSEEPACPTEAVAEELRSDTANAGESALEREAICCPDLPDASAETCACEGGVST
jgi:alkylhydroperoxidase/carboxymuconolactone decarboxylase family protein YurZ